MTVTGQDAHSWQVETVGRPHPGRKRVSIYPITKEISSRYADLDPNGHLNNVALESMHEDVRATLNAQVFPGVYSGSGPRLRIVNSQTIVHFLAEAHWPCVIEAGIGVTRVGRSSFVLSSALFDGDRCISLCDSVMVAVLDGPVPLSEEARAGLLGVRVRGSLDAEGRTQP